MTGKENDATVIPEADNKLVSAFLKSLENERKTDVDEMNSLLSSLSAKSLAAKGLAVMNLVLGSMRTGLGGKTILELELDSSISGPEKQKIDGKEIRTGDIVKIENQQSSTSKKVKESNLSPRDRTNQIEAVVLKVAEKSISIAVEEKYDSIDLNMTGRLWIAKLANSVTYKRMERALQDFKSKEGSSKLLRILLGQEDPVLVDSSMDDDDFMDSTLNEPQRQAIRFALGSDLAIIHGPPGTGKTYTLVEIIRQLVAQDKRVLVCGPSNISVDNILERLHPHIKGNYLLRLGHPARLLESNLIHSLELVSKTSNQGQIIRDIRQEIDTLLKSIRKTKTGREKKEIYSNIKELRKDYRIREKTVVSNIILEAKVVVGTLHGAGSYSIKDAMALSAKPLFDAIIIDEVSQSLEPQCWIPIAMCPNTLKLIIAGDNNQLPPTIKTKSNQDKKVLETTLFDRLVKLYGRKITRLLSIQYRMNSKIMEFSSNEFYDGKLIAADSVASRTLCDLEGVEENEMTTSPVYFIDTQGDDFLENAKTNDDLDIGQSSLNESEAYLVKNYVGKLLGYGVKPNSIGVIAPYSAQVSFISKLLDSYPEIEISTVDGFQGREKDVIIMSLVRSNEKREVGFLAETRRLNVAITRPRLHLCMIGNSETISKDKFLRRWVKWAENEADIEYPDVSSIY